MATRQLNVLLTGDPAGMKKAFASATASAGRAKIGIAAAAVGAGLALKELYDVGEEFADAFDTIRVGTGATGKQLDRLKADFKSVVAEVPTDFEPASEAIADINTRLGLVGKPLRNLSRQFLELSRITGSDVSEDIKLVARSFGDWEVAAGRQSKQLDIFFRASQMSGASVAELSKLVVDFGAPLRQMGFDLDEAIAMFASFEKAGVNIQTMVPGLKFALKTFISEGRDPAKALQMTFKGIADGTISAEKALKLFGQRAGADMVEAVEQGRFNLAGFTEEIRTGKDTISKAGEETKHASERFKEFGNFLKVQIEPAATAAFEAVGQFTHELLQLDFQSPISGAVAMGVAFAGVATAVLAAKKAISATFLLLARNPFGALVLGAGFAVGALVALNRTEERNINVFRRSKRVLDNLANASKQIKQARGREESAARAVKRAEEKLTGVRKRFGPNSQQAIEAEARLARLRQRLKEESQRLRNLERKHGTERRAAAILLRGDTRALARQSELLREQQEKEVGQLKHLITNRKSLAEHGLDTKRITELIRDKQNELGSTTGKLNTKNKQLNEILVRAGREIGPKFADKLSTMIERTQKATRRTSELGRWLDKLPKKKKVDVDVKINIGGIGGVNTGGGGGGSGDGWGMGKALNRGIDSKVRGKVQEFADEHPMAALMAGAGIGGASLGAGGPGAWRAFIPFARRFGLDLSSGIRPGAVTSTGNRSYHAMNRAGDFSGSPAGMLGFARFMAAAFGRKLKELIYTPLGFSIKDGAKVAPYARADHKDHVHAAYRHGGRRSHKQTSPTIMYGEEAPQYPEYYISTNPRDRKRSMGLINEALGEIVAFRKGGKRDWKQMVGSRWDNNELATLAHVVGMPNPGLMAQYAQGESSGNAGAVNHNTDGSVDRGLWQINSVHGFKGNLFDPWRNAQAAKSILASQGLGAWYASPTGPKGKVDPELAAAMRGRGTAKQARGGGGSAPAPKMGIGGAKAVELPPLKAGVIPEALRGLGSGISRLFNFPSRNASERRSQLFSALETGLSIAEDTAGTADDEALLGFQIGASKQRKQKVNKEIRRLNKRLQERLSPKQRAQILNKRSNLLGERDELQGRIKQARGTREELLPTPRDFADLALARAEGTKDKGDDIVALEGLKSVAEQELAVAKASGDPREIAEATRNLTQAAQALEAAQPTKRDFLDRDLALAELTEGSEDDRKVLERMERHAAQELREAEKTADPRDDIEAARLLKQIRDQLKQMGEQLQVAEESKSLADELARIRAIMEDSEATSAAVAWRALADIISGQLGARAHEGALTAGTGEIGSVGRL